jgi:hypothetical protein
VGPLESARSTRAREAWWPREKSDGNRDGKSIVARIFAPWRRWDDNLPLMLSYFGKLLESTFSCFAKIRYMPSSYWSCFNLYIYFFHQLI